MKRIILAALLMTLSLLLFAEYYSVNSNPNEVKVLTTSAQETVLEMTLGHFNRQAVTINGSTYWVTDIKKEGITLDAGMPQLPYISRSIIIPNAARMTMQVLDSEFTDIIMPIAPSKGNLTRDINPDDVAWSFDTFYQTNGSYPSELASLSEPFILRDYRGITVYFKPMVYFPATQILRVYTKMRLSVTSDGTDNVNVLTTSGNAGSVWFDKMYSRMFINYNEAKYPILDEQGRIIVVTNSMFNTTLQPYVDWKRQKGFTVDVVDIATAGPTALQLKTYIQGQYDLNNGLAFVQIMGDHAQVPSLTAGGGSSDPSFALLAGGDNYPDIFVGRFSATTTTELETQITRSVQYERDMAANNSWLATGIGIASNQGGGSTGDLGESDQTHIENIRTDLLTYGFSTVDQVYEAQGATVAQISTGVNAGRGFINYCGHGSDTYWVTTGFSNTNVNQLTNDNKLPFIVSVACVNGNFTNQTCFAEAWLRARDSVTGNPRGAVAFYGSTINMGWNPPMRGQDEITDLLVANTMNTIGGLFYNGSSKMTEIYGTSGASEYKCWHIFGDASLMVRTTEPQPMTASYSDVMFIGSPAFEVTTEPGAWVSIYANGINYGSAYAGTNGTAVVPLTPVPTEPMNLTITITAFNKITHIGTVEVVPSQGAYVQVANQAVSDNNNNQPDTGETIFLDITLNNVGTEEAENVTAVISTTDQYLNITTDTASYGSIPAGQTANSTAAFVLEIADNVPDQYAAQIHVIINVDGVFGWEYDRSLVINAPAFSAITAVIDDTSGNSNGAIEAGETVLITVPVTNSGHAPATDVLFSLMVLNPISHIMTPVQYLFPLIPTGESVNAIFEVTFSSQVPSGTQAQFLLLGISGEYALSFNFNQIIGQVMENFDNGTMTNYPWTFGGGDWTLDTTTYHSANASAKSYPITNSMSTNMSVTMQVPAAGNITFWKKVSSEASYDFMKFYIDNVQQNQWSGEINWSQETFTVTPGQHTFKWEYMKDYTVAGGSDCAWVDDIVFPSTGGTTGTPGIDFSDNAFDFGTHMAADFEPVTLRITNYGDAVMIGTITGSDIFRVKPVSETDYVTYMNFVVPAGLYVDVNIMIFPETDGVQNYELSISSDDPVSPFSFISLTANVLPTSNEDPTLPTVTVLKGNFPNPFNPETNVAFSLKSDSRVTLDIYNVAGQKVKTLVNDQLQAGNHSYKWNGQDDNGRNVSSGIYFTRMNAGSYHATSKMVLMK
jgi:hypothetical protein